MHQLNLEEVDNDDALNHFLNSQAEHQFILLTAFILILSGEELLISISVMACTGNENKLKI